MRLGYLDILDDEQSKRVVKAVDKLEKTWIRRAPEPLDFYTCGAVTYMEGVTSNSKYHKHAALMNPVLKKHLTWLYDILIEKLSAEVGPCELYDQLAYPGFHVFGHKPGKLSDPFCGERFSKPLASLHVDIQYRDHMGIWNQFDEVDLEDTLSFTLPVELPRTGGGLFVWDWMAMDEQMIAKFNFQSNSEKDATLKNFMEHSENVDFKNRPEFFSSEIQGTLERVSGCAEEFIQYHSNNDPRESREFWENGSLPLQYNPIYDSAPLVVPYKVGQMFYHTGHVLHQIIPGYDLQPDDRRITLQGHGIKCDGIWRLYF